MPSAQWGYVPTDQNPADCSSRGISIQEYASHSLWWEGPSWLKASPESWPKPPTTRFNNIELETKSNRIVSVACKRLSWDLASKYSRWPKLLRVTAYVLRFISCCRPHHFGTPSALAKVSSVILRSVEIRNAKGFWISYIQHELFYEEIDCLTKSLAVPKHSPLISLNPFLDPEGLIRVGGRLRQADLAYESRHPIVLKAHPLVSLIIRELHICSLHGGLQLMLCTVRIEYRILRALSVIRSVLRDCVRCARERAETPVQLMGDLPESRVRPTSRAFIHTGVDYARPILIRSASCRGHKSHKSYISLFVCLTTRAIHLELVNDYSTEACLAAFQRFCKKWGLPCSFYSENGTQFHVADRELTSAYQSAVTDQNFQNTVATDGVDWHFIPPCAPGFGAMGEAGVRSVKYHIKRVIGSHTLTYEEFITLLSQIEACLNSRPLLPLSDCIDDYRVLPPGHFLIGQPLTTPP